MPVIESFGDVQLQRLCDVLADTSSGLTGSEIGKLLGELGIADLLPGMTKRHRLYEALRARQQQDRCGNLIVEFVHRAMDPVRYTDNSGYTTAKREMDALKAEGVVEFVGASKTGYYTLAKTASV